MDGRKTAVRIAHKRGGKADQFSNARSGWSQTRKGVIPTITSARKRGWLIDFFPKRREEEELGVLPYLSEHCKKRKEGGRKLPFP